MVADITAIYRAARAFIVARPLIMAIPFVCALAQQFLFDPAALPPADRQAALAGFTVVSSIAMLIVSASAFRWWRFAEDPGAATPLSWRVPFGAVVMILVQLIDEAIFTTLGRFAAYQAGGGLIFFLPGSLLLWLFVSIPLYPWYVGMIANDPAMKLKRAFRAIRPQWLPAFAVVLGAVLPVVAIGLVLKFARARTWGVPGALIDLASAVLIPLLIVITAAAYFSTYRRARAADRLVSAPLPRS